MFNEKITSDDNFWLQILSPRTIQRLVQKHMHAVSVLQNLRYSVVILGMPTTLYEIGLWMYFGSDEKLFSMEICKVDITNRGELCKLFYTLYGCTRSLVDSPIHDHNPSALIAKCCSKGGHIVLGESLHYCPDKNIVTKFFDTKIKGY